MKELSIEEKAKAYDSMFERLKKMYENNKTNVADRLIYERYFPELKESEGEKMMRVLIGGLKSYVDMYSEWYDGVSTSEIIAWLEKQGEQKPTISYDALREGIGHYGITQYQIDNWLKKYVDVEKQGKQKPAETEKGKKGNNGEIPNSEQNHADMSDKLKEEYQKGWDAAMLQLPKEVDSQIWQIANNSAKTWEESFAILCATQKAYDKGKKDALKEQNSTWSEEDETKLKSACALIRNTSLNGNEDVIDSTITFLKSLKGRVQPQNIACYNPYKEVVESIAEMCTYYDKASHSGLRDFYDNVKVKCKDAKEYDSLYPQNTWKPSDLPHWKKSNLPNDNVTGFNSDYFCHKGYGINYKELFDKLPKDD